MNTDTDKMKLWPCIPFKAFQGVDEELPAEEIEGRVAQDHQGQVWLLLKDRAPMRIEEPICLAAQINSACGHEQDEFVDRPTFKRTVFTEPIHGMLLQEALSRGESQ